ncbi:hypothetical protein T492DRAFT_886195 [Pavlovales sp. CCMP2436]|nr:hypothetical protein T492DRAFT_886195 [Pavlovales sp. CCMP2436]
MPSTSADAPRRCHVVIAGAGPAGILAAINFLRRNKGGAASVEYSVSIVDPGEDFGELTPEGLEKKRSWMIGLSAHGLAALRRVPGLYTDHVSKVGVPIHTNAIYLGKSKFMASDANVEGFVVDRNFVVAAMARCLNDAFKDSGLLTRHYNSRVLYVDPDCRRVCVRGADGADNFVSYDLLIGADGIRSPGTCYSMN